MAYKYDIFLSYNRRFPHGNWVSEVFFPLFEAYMCEVLNKEVIIFKDNADIKSGQDWKHKIEHALIHSKILVPIFSPAYFRSEWCKKEFAVMDYRQRLCNCQTFENPNGLIIPIKLFDGEHFPDYVNSIQISDFSNYNRIGGGVTQTSMYIEFQGELQRWVNHVAQAYNYGPDWNDEWKKSEWLINAWDSLDKLNSPLQVKAPVL